MSRDALTQMLIRHEGMRPFPYLDTVGKTTIGVGRNLTAEGLSQAEIMVLFDNDLDAVIRDLQSFDWFAGLSDARQQALCDLRFNLGHDGFRQFRKMIHAIAVKNYTAAAQEMRQSLWAKQVKNRAEELAQMMERG